MRFRHITPPSFEEFGHIPQMILMVPEYKLYHLINIHFYVHNGLTSKDWSKKGLDIWKLRSLHKDWGQYNSSHANTACIEICLCVTTFSNITKMDMSHLTLYLIFLTLIYGKSTLTDPQNTHRFQQETHITNSKDLYPIRVLMYL